MSTDILTISFMLFLIANPVGNTPAILSLIRQFPFEQQKRIVFREGIFALLLILFFQFFGEYVFSLLQIKPYAIGFCGGILLLIVALNMIFAKPSPEPTAQVVMGQEPFFVPIATPIISGPGLLTLVMLYSSKMESSLPLTLAILIAWVGVLGVMMAGPYLQKTLHRRGMVALEQLMGMLLVFMAADMMVNATANYIKS